MLARVCAAVAVLALALASPAAAGNAQHGDNAGASEQDGLSRSGDAVGGPGLVVIREGDVSVEMTHGPQVQVQRVEASAGTIRMSNPSRSVTVTSGDGVGSNAARVFVGLQSATGDDVLADVLAFAFS